MTRIERVKSGGIALLHHQRIAVPNHWARFGDWRELAACAELGGLTR
jgi:hypothetical protein